MGIVFLLVMSEHGRAVKEEASLSIKFSNFQKVWASGDTAQFESERLTVGGGSFTVQVQMGNDVADLVLVRVDSHSMPVHSASQILFDGGSWSANGWMWYPEWARSAGCRGNDAKKVALNTLRWPNFRTSTRLLEIAQGNGDCIEMKVSIAAWRPCSFNPLESLCCLRAANLTSAFETFGHTAVTITAANGAAIQVSKAFICTYSTVLEAALESNMIEGTSNTIFMPDVRVDVLKDFATCLYTGGLHPSIVTEWKRLADLLVVADKYGVSPLAEACVMHLSVCLSKDNFGELLRLVDQGGLTSLRRPLVYFSTHDDEIWTALTDSDEYTSLSADLMRDLCSHRSQGPHLQKSQTDAYGTGPLLLQWGQVDREFADDAKWETLPGDSLRRACFERELGTSGTSAELVARLSSARTRGTISPQGSPG